MIGVAWKMADFPRKLARSRSVSSNQVTQYVFGSTLSDKDADVGCAAALAAQQGTDVR